ncbi:MAG: ABC transporter ATP-binding protein [Verrucomicrobiota bacterium]
MNPIVEGKNLSRFYGLILGLNNVSFTIGSGITGVVGSNGAGKTTLFRLLTGQIRASSGSLTVFGLDPWNNPDVQARIAYCPESEDVPADIGARDWLIALGMISGLSSMAARQIADRKLEEVRLPSAHWKKNLTSLSKGMRQRVKLAQCLLHDPQLVILDEPMNGLDPMGREDVANVLKSLAAQGKSILISSHILDDLEALCSQFLLLRAGRIPKSLNEEVSNARRRWPEATTIRCQNPDQLARFLFSKALLKGCDVLEESGTLHARWRDPILFYESFHEILLESGVRIFEIQNTESHLEHTMAPTLKS